MNAPESPSDPTDQPLVEDEWRRILTEYDITEGPADLLVAGVLGGPDIRRTSPSREQLRSLVERNLADSALESKLADPTQLGEVQARLMEALDDALEGRFGGPASAPQEIAYSGMKQPPATGHPDPPRTPNAMNAGFTRAKADPGRGAVEPDAAPVYEVEVPPEFAALSDAEQELVEYLWEFIDTNDLDENELATAAAFVAMHDDPEDESKSMHE